MKNRQFTYLLLATIIFTIVSCDYKENKSEKPDGYITRSVAVQLENDYVKVIHNRTEKTNREFWFSIEEMEKIVNHTKHVADSLNAKNIGIRAYLGAKQDENGTWNTELFFIPTGNTTGAKSIASGNLEGLGGYNLSNSGMPPVELTNP